MLRSRFTCALTIVLGFGAAAFAQPALKTGTEVLHRDVR